MAVALALAALDVLDQGSVGTSEIGDAKNDSRGPFNSVAERCGFVTDAAQHSL